MPPGKNYFKIRIANCGTRWAYGAYSTLKDRSALRIVCQALNQIIDGIVPKNFRTRFKRVLIQQLMAEFDGTLAPLDDYNVARKWYISSLTKKRRIRRNR